jgi:hypothetical protein
MPKHFRIPFTRIHIGRFLFLLISMVLMFALRPFLESFVRISYLMDIFFIVIFLSAVYAISQKRSTFIIALVMALLIEILIWLGHLTDISSLRTIGNFLAILFIGYTATVILSYLFTEDKITSDVIMGAICVYFLIGLAWAFIFFTLELFQPGSFQMPQGQGIDLSHFSYYSYVTLTTLGYGDITPISTQARSLALLEAIMGQLYLAILVARLVGIHIAQGVSRNAK